MPRRKVLQGTGQDYGDAQAMQESQDIVPAVPQAGVNAPSVPTAEEVAQATPFSPRSITSPTEAPGEPWTAGLTRGPGPGPESLVPPTPYGGPVTSPPVDPKALVPMLSTLEALATNSIRPVDAATRSLIRRIRGNLPPETDLGEF